MKGVFVILDGVGDEPNMNLDGKTPLEVANTPNLDFLAGKGKMDYCYTVKEGIAPEGSAAVASLFGQDYLSAGRGVLEAIGMGIPLRNGDLVLRCNFSTISDIDSGEVLDRRAGRTLSSEETRQLAEAINSGLNEKFKFHFYPGGQHRSVLVFKGGFSDNISNIDPAYSNCSVNKDGGSKIKWCVPLDDEEDSKLSSELVNNFVRHSHQILDKHRINNERARKGLFAANFLLCRDAGSRLPKWKKLKGKWIALGYSPLEIGIAKSLGMEVYGFGYPRLKGIDVYSNLYSGLNKAIKNSIKMLKWKKKKFDYFYIHIKETDIPGHDGNVRDKIKMIEIIDKRLFGFLRGYLGNDGRMVLTGSNVTSSRRKMHTDGAVPVLTYPHPSGKEVEGQRFTEKFAMTGRKILGKKLLEQNFFGH